MIGKAIIYIPTLCALSRHNGCIRRGATHHQTFTHLPSSCSCTGCTNSPVIAHTPMSHSSTAFLQSQPSCRNSNLFRSLFLCTSADDEYILRLCRDERAERCGMVWTREWDAKDTPFRRGAMLSSSSLSPSLSELGTDTRPGRRSDPSRRDVVVDPKSSSRRASPRSHEGDSSSLHLASPPSKPRARKAWCAGGSHGPSMESACPSSWLSSRPSTLAPSRERHYSQLIEQRSSEEDG